MRSMELRKKSTQTTTMTVELSQGLQAKDSESKTGSLS
jgi:hypothetical protein